MTERKQSADTGAKAKPGMAFDPVEAALRQIFDDVASEETCCESRASLIFLGHRVRTGGCLLMQGIRSRPR
ncbi:hypothetical protein, partial [Porphyrobacter sp. TH134]|uniref:hypothetical protein n=1 Tax=Porphyrobacter sp. TH134 TaxID=2067450 RepID=UPI001F2BCD27